MANFDIYYGLPINSVAGFPSNKLDITVGDVGFITPPYKITVNITMEAPDDINNTFTDIILGSNDIQQSQGPYSVNLLALLRADNAVGPLLPNALNSLKGLFARWTPVINLVSENTQNNNVNTSWVGSTIDVPIVGFQETVNPLFLDFINYESLGDFTLTVSGNIQFIYTPTGKPEQTLGNSNRTTPLITIKDR